MQIQVMLVLMHHLKVESRQLCGITESKGTKNYGGTMFTSGEGDHH
jgi:hypothetical protein